VSKLFFHPNVTSCESRIAFVIEGLKLYRCWIQQFIDCTDYHVWRLLK